jgi:hypothetical protein
MLLLRVGQGWKVVGWWWVGGWVFTLYDGDGGGGWVFTLYDGDVGGWIGRWWWEWVDVGGCGKIAVEVGGSRWMCEMDGEVEYAGVRSGTRDGCFRRGRG